MRPFRHRCESHSSASLSSERYREPSLSNSSTLMDDITSHGAVVAAFAPPLNLVIDYKIGWMKTECILDDDAPKHTQRNRRKSIDLDRNDNDNNDNTFEVYGATVESLRRKNKKKNKKKKKKKVKKNNESVLNRLKRTYGNDFEIYC
eukprot:352256_1